MARMDRGNCVYVGRRSVCSLLSSEVRDHCFSIPLSYSYFTASNLRTLFVEQETACVDGDLLSRLFCLFSMDSPRWTNLDFKYGFLRRFYFPVLIFFPPLPLQVSAPILPTISAVDGSSCLPQFLPRAIYRFWIPMLSYESLLCVLVLIQGFRRFKSDSSIFRSGKRLVSILIRDSIIYFLVCVFHLSFFLLSPSVRVIPLSFSSFSLSCPSSKLTFFSSLEHM